MPFNQANSNNEFFGYDNLKEYLDHLYDVLYLVCDSCYLVKHIQETGADRVEAIAKARKRLGADAYFISVTKHAQDMQGE